MEYIANLSYVHFNTSNWQAVQFWPNLCHYFKILLSNYSYTNFFTCKYVKSELFLHCFHNLLNEGCFQKTRCVTDIKEKLPTFSLSLSEFLQNIDLQQHLAGVYIKSWMVVLRTYHILHENQGPTSLTRRVITHPIWKGHGKQILQQR